MISNYILEVNGEQLDPGDGTTSLNYQLESITDPTKRKTNFTKTLNLPGTTKNNKFFKHLFDVNVKLLTFNPSITASKAIVRNGDSVVFSGNLQLVSVTNTDGKISYQVSIYGRLSSIITNFSDHKISRANFLEYEHIRNKQTIYDSYSYLIYKNGTLTQSQPGDGYVYPYIVRELPSGYNGDELYIYNQFPALYVKTILDKIFQYAGYTYTSNFFDSEYFRKLIIPYSNDKIQMPEEDFSNRTTTVGVDSEQPENTVGEYISPSGYAAIAGPYVINTGWHYNEPYGYPMRLLREQGEVGDKEFQDPQNSWSEYMGWECQQGGYYNFDMDLKLFAKYTTTPSNPFRWSSGTNGTIDYYFGVRLLKPGQQAINLGNSEVFQFTPTVGGDYKPNPWYDLEVPLQMQRTINNIWMEPGDRLVVFFAHFWPGNNFNAQFQYGDQPDNTVRLRFVAKESFGGEPSYINIYPSSNTSMGNEVINMNKMVPDMAMKDFFLEIARLFNLVIYDNPNKDKDLIMEPYDDFFASKEKIKDWNYKINHDDEIIITPMSEINFRNMLFTYVDDKDFYNEQYQNQTNEIYGQNSIDIKNDFSQEEQKYEVKFAASPGAQPFLGSKVAPHFAKSELSGIFTPINVKPRILFYNPILNTTSVYLKDSPEEDIADAITFSGYPYCGMWDHPTDPKYSLEFGPTQFLYYNSDFYPSYNLYNQFHRGKMNNIVDINSKILEAKFHLTPLDISTFDFRDIIELKGQYWRVLEIKDYDVSLTRELTTVVLYRLSEFNSSLPSQNKVPISNNSCPFDISLSRVGLQFIYVSRSGLYVSEDCCNAIGGRWNNGTCYMGADVNPNQFGNATTVIGSGDEYGNVSTEILPITVNQKSPFSQANGPDIFRNGLNSINSPGITVQGKNNWVGEGVSNIAIYGNNNSVQNGVTNVIINGNNILAAVSNAVYFGNVMITADGQIIPIGTMSELGSAGIIDAGLNTVFPPEKVTPINIIDGGLNVVRNFFADVTNVAVIDANNYQPNGQYDGLNVEYKRFLVKRSDMSGVTPTIPTNPTVDATYTNTDIMVGEFFANVEDDRLWFRTNNAIEEITITASTEGWVPYDFHCYLYDTTDSLAAFSGFGAYSLYTYEAQRDFEIENIVMYAKSPLEVGVVDLYITVNSENVAFLQIPLNEQINDVLDIYISEISQGDILKFYIQHSNDDKCGITVGFKCRTQI
jgi:hypothetical protein